MRFRLGVVLDGQHKFHGAKQVACAVNQFEIFPPGRGDHGHAVLGAQFFQDGFDARNLNGFAPDEVLIKPVADSTLPLDCFGCGATGESEIPIRASIGHEFQVRALLKIHSERSDRLADRSVVPAFGIHQHAVMIPQDESFMAGAHRLRPGIDVFPADVCQPRERFQFPAFSIPHWFADKIAIRTLGISKPKSYAYPPELKTIDDCIRKRRIKLNLF